MFKTCLKQMFLNKMFKTANPDENCSLHGCTYGPISLPIYPSIW
jgi:hypothetical protein